MIEQIHQSLSRDDTWVNASRKVWIANECAIFFTWNAEFLRNTWNTSVGLERSTWTECLTTQKESDSGDNKLHGQHTQHYKYCQKEDCVVEGTACIFDSWKETDVVSRYPHDKRSGTNATSKLTLTSATILAVNSLRRLSSSTHPLCVLDQWHACIY